jgi:hypothetical protein
MVIHYPPVRLRHNSSDRPTAITGVLIATSGSSYQPARSPGHPDLLGPLRPRPLGALPQRRGGRGRLAPVVPWSDHRPRLPVSWTA